ncbi:MAG: molybdenum cofactor guanylyltransferase MobA [Rhodospirillaceae bacterium]|nr:molybdenum cofactor guanylyltransferase MobA [Rhodospirillaceae bacterium]MYH39100.1 molybdenum cofactor guanylyltransferase MobA [Rhodospirillaceae bacterium]MYK15023.1 molybdenum cofactor guanylyltransferase MobA [Rhodospirillaceae bacterium]MYK57498.1 molybdenum cofactor guanylyltransferase MobA [Rhodospirillaceae bacterium]
MSAGPSDPATVGVLLAGGRARRMGGGDKCLRRLAGRPLLAHAIERIAPQVGRLVLNANGDPGRFAAFGLPVAADILPGQPGPLAGVLTGMAWAAANAPDAGWILTAATDAPFLPPDLAERLRAAIRRDGADMACAASAGRHHPVIGLWPVGLRDDLEAALRDEGITKVDRWTARYRLAVAEFDAGPPDPFFNANRPEDLETAERLLPGA